MRFLAFGSVVLGVLGIASAQETRDAYFNRIQEWRHRVEQDLKADNGWLTVSGLYWLSEGTTSFGEDAKAKLVIPWTEDSEALGAFVRTGNSVSLKVPAETRITLNGQPAASVALKSDAAGQSDRIAIGARTLTVIQRGQRIGIRVYDQNSAARKSFSGLQWFPIDPTYCIQAKYVGYPKAKQLPITNVLGDTAPVSNPGYVLFTLKGKVYRLEAQDAGDGLFFNFHDQTSGKSTYDAGRFLDAPRPVNSFVTLDFNQATNPPCAFTNYATCPLPPKSNFLRVDIPAGEKRYQGVKD